MLKDLERSNKTVVLFVTIMDVIVINVLFLLFSTFMQTKYGVIVYSGDSKILYTSFCLCYLISSYFSEISLYRRRIRIDQVVRISLRGMTIFILIWITVIFLMDYNTHLSRYFVHFFIFIAITIIAMRIIFRSIIIALRSQGRNQCAVVFMGSQQNIVGLYEEMTMSLSTGYKILGYFDDKPNENMPNGCQYLGTCKETEHFLQNNHVDRLYCGLASNHDSIILNIIRFCEGHVVRFYIVPNLSNYLHRRVTLEMFSNTPVLSIRNEPLTLIENKVIKRLFDIIVSLVFICTLYLIIYVIVGILIKITSPGPIYFKQIRSGIDGKEFVCYKFRSMKVNVDSDKVQATLDDPRKTKLGNFLRKSSIDELPQFINVLKGDMSIVGPRPHMLKHTEEYSDIISAYMVRHLVKPGITGWAQVTGFRGETKELKDMEGRVKADIWYMEHWTFMLDLYIIYKTVANVVLHKDKDAY